MTTPARCPLSLPVGQRAGNTLGLDPSLTGTGAVVVDDQGTIIYQALIATNPAQDVVDRVHYIASKIIVAVEDYQVGKVIMEGLSFGAKGDAITHLAGLHWVIRHELKYGLIYHLVPQIVPPTTLKKWVTGKGNAPKDVMMLHAYKRWGVEFSNHNLCDGFCLAMWGISNQSTGGKTK